MFPNLYLMYVDIRKEIRGTVTIITQDRVAVEVTLLNEVSLGVLYFEKPKQTWVNKPIMPTKWRCVDANVEGVFQWGGEKVSPKELMEWAQELVEKHLKEEGEDVDKEQDPND